VAGLLDAEQADVVGAALPLYPPHSFVGDAETKPWVEVSRRRLNLGKTVRRSYSRGRG
jgi:hypothetical protein